jgi:hypothetical protein
MPYSIGADYTWKEVGEKVVILNLESGRYFSLNSTGSVIWTAIMERLSLDETVARLCLAFDVDEATGRQDVETLIQEFLDKGMVVAD